MIRGEHSAPLIVSRAQSLLAADCDAVIRERLALWGAFRNTRIFITGGTGFVGSWLLEVLTRATATLDLGLAVVVLTRSPERFLRKAPHLARHPSVRLHVGDVTSYSYPPGVFDLVIHGAADASRLQNQQNPFLTFDTIVTGTARTLDFAAQSGCRRFLFVSSGAVYGRQPPSLQLIPEDFPGAPDCTVPTSAYGEAKRAAELLCTLRSSNASFKTTIARCFALAGPYLPLDGDFAIGNFIGNRLRGEPIVVQGDGRTVRSYLYASDLALWLLTILVEGNPGRPYNVGSPAGITIAELAYVVASGGDPPLDVNVLGSPDAGRPVDRYVPSTHRAEHELGLRASVDLLTAILRTAEWYRANDSSASLGA